ncbi:addiction module protein [candidate division KSB1 bacterium]|nr:addiction module protein [candidate division KSB1 bacterium]
MLTAEELIDQAASLPIEARASIIDSLLKTINPMDDVIDRKWLEIAKRRLQELRAGVVKPIPGEEIFQKVKARFSK